MNSPTPKHVSLFLRSDGSLMIVSNGVASEMQMSGSQLLQLGIDCLQVAVRLEPHCMAAAAEALANTNVLPERSAPCTQ